MKEVEIPTWAQQVVGVGLRKVIVIAGTALASRGLVMEGGFDPTAVDQMVGAGLTLAGVAWSIWSEWQKRQALKTAIEAPAATPVTK